MCNMGTLDRLLRLLIGAVLVALVFTGPETLWGWIGIIPLATSIICVCPVYSIIGVSSTGKKVD